MNLMLTMLSIDHIRRRSRSGWNFAMFPTGLACFSGWCEHHQYLLI